MGKVAKLGVASAADRQARIDLAGVFRLAAHKRILDREEPGYAS
jgi:hypothetical protein